MMQKLLTNPLVRYILAGAGAYAIELATLLTLHTRFHLSAELATAIAFWVGFPTAFFLQKAFAFKDYQKTLKAISKQVFLYAALVAFNYAFTITVVSLFPDNLVAFSRTLALAITTTWNFVLYHYMFDVEKHPIITKIEQLAKSVTMPKNKWVNLALLGLPVVLFCLPLIVTGSKIAAGDPDYNFQSYEAMRRSILEFGQFPMWNPWIAGGIPLFANIQLGVVSIQTPFVLLFGAVLGLKIAVMAYGIIGFFGFRKLFRDCFGASSLRATLLAYIPIFGSFFVYRVMAGHFTFLMIAFVPWLLYFFLKRERKRSWLGFALIYSLMVWSAPHYTTIMAGVIVVLWVIFEQTKRLIAAARGKNWQPFLAKLKTDALFFAKAGALIAVLCAYRMYFVIQFLRDFPRLEQGSNEPFTGLKSIYALWGPNQYAHPPILRNGWGWVEASAYIGIGTLICLGIVAGVYIHHRYTKQKRPIPTGYSIAFLTSLFIGIMIIAQGNFGAWSPYHLLSQLPVFSSMRVATRWLMWTSLFVLFILAAYQGNRFKKTINVILALTVIELFVTGSHYIGSPYVIAMHQYRPPSATFDQQILYRVPRPDYLNDKKFLAAYAYDENLAETTRNNYGQVVAGDSLVDTRPQHSTIRCGANQGHCQFLSDNAVMTYWSPNKIVLKRIGPGPININMNPGKGWRVNGASVFSNYKVTDPLRAFIIDNPAQTITLEYAPFLSPAWIAHSIGL